GLARLRISECSAEPMQFLLREISFPFQLPEFCNVSARIAAIWAQSPFLGKIHHFRKDAQRAVGLVPTVPYSLMKVRNIGTLNVADTVLTERWVDEKLHRPPVFAGCVWLAVLRHVISKKTGPELRHRYYALLTVALRRRIFSGCLQAQKPKCPGAGGVGCPRRPVAPNSHPTLPTTGAHLQHVVFGA